MVRDRGPSRSGDRIPPVVQQPRHPDDPSGSNFRSRNQSRIEEQDCRHGGHQTRGRQQRAKDDSHPAVRGRKSEDFHGQRRRNKLLADSSHPSDVGNHAVEASEEEEAESSTVERIGLVPGRLLRALLPNHRSRIRRRRRPSDLQRQSNQKQTSGLFYLNLCFFREKTVTVQLHITLTQVYLNSAYFYFYKDPQFFL